MGLLNFFKSLTSLLALVELEIQKFGFARSLTSDKRVILWGGGPKLFLGPKTAVTTPLNKI